MEVKYKEIVRKILRQISIKSNNKSAQHTMKRKTTENVKSTQLIVVLCRRFSRVQHPQEHEKKNCEQVRIFHHEQKGQSVCVCARAFRWANER